MYLVIFVGLSACGGYNSEAGAQEESPAVESVSVEGSVRVAGSTPFERVMLERADGPELELRGEYREELQRLQGAIVRVEGRPGERNLFRVSDYRIVAIGGERPFVGVLQRGEEQGLGIRAPTGEWLGLDSAPAELTDKVGSKVWVITGPEGEVRSFGVLREGMEDSG